MGGTRAGMRESQESWISRVSSPDEEHGASADVGDGRGHRAFSQPQLRHLQRSGRGEDAVRACMGAAWTSAGPRGAAGRCPGPVSRALS